MSDAAALPPTPRERDYDRTVDGALDFARDLNEWIKAYIDVRNKHRQAAIDQLAQSVYENTADLTRGDIRPGWVQVQVGLLRGDIAALLEDNRGIRRRQWWVFTSSASALISLLVVLAAQVLHAKGGP